MSASFVLHKIQQKIKDNKENYDTDKFANRESMSHFFGENFDFNCNQVQLYMNTNDDNVITISEVSLLYVHSKGEKLNPKKHDNNGNNGKNLLHVGLQNSVNISCKKVDVDITEIFLDLFLEKTSLRTVKYFCFIGQKLLDNYNFFSRYSFEIIELSVQIIHNLNSVKNQSPEHKVWSNYENNNIYIREKKITNDEKIHRRKSNKTKKVTRDHNDFTEITKTKNSYASTIFTKNFEAIIYKNFGGKSIHIHGYSFDFYFGELLPGNIFDMASMKDTKNRNENEILWMPD